MANKMRTLSGTILAAAMAVSLAYSVFADGATFTDALTGESAENAFSLAPYGYRGLILNQ